MTDIDMNLLVALDVLLAEASVTGAARRLGLSTSAMSRTLNRLRTAIGDPLLVRAGRGLVPTPHAVAMRDHVRDLTRDVRTILRPPQDTLELQHLEQTFTLRCSEGFLERFLVPLVTAVRQAAPRVTLRFAPKPDKDARPLREGPVDLDIGVLASTARADVQGPELRTRFLFRDAMVGAVRSGHPLLSMPITPERYAACQHVAASRRGASRGPVDDGLAQRGLARRVVAVVPGFPDALRLAEGSDLVALVPRSSLSSGALVAFELPVPTPEVVVLAMWHPRLDVDPAHRWLREIIHDVCQRELGKVETPGN